MRAARLRSRDSRSRSEGEGDSAVAKQVRLLAALLAVGFAAVGCSDSDLNDAVAEPSDHGDTEVVTITIESWRTDDAAIWNDHIIPVFEAEFPSINVEFNPTAPADYDLTLDNRLAAGTAGDLITCRPFDASLALFERGDLTPLADLPGITVFSSVAQSAWITDDGTTPFCVPMASVIHGFIYNRTAFDDLGLSKPHTEEEFFELLRAIADDGTYVPLGIGTADQWEAATMGFQNIGPNYWAGEEGRLALIDGTAKLTDPPYVDTFATLQRWSEYLPTDAATITYADAQNLFTLGKAAVYPAGSWEIAGFNANTDFELGAFRPPARNDADACYISDHVDIALGMNPATPHPDAVQTFLSWVASSEFANIYANALPGFFSLQDVRLSLDDPLAREFVSWRSECESTIRNSYQILSRGTPNLESELWAVSASVLNGDMTPDEATTRLQAGLDTWYTPE